MVRAVLLSLLLLASAQQKPGPAGTRAAFWRSLDNKRVACELCPRGCVIGPGQRGLCRVRENRDGVLYSLVYGRPCSVTREPIEKAPFFHFLPGSVRIGLATAGCNQSCKYCQNWELSSARPEDLPSYELMPEDVVALAVKEQVPVICFTYTEPVVFYEYMCDVARLARTRGVKTTVVTGGYINPEPLAQLCGLVDGIKIDLKGFTPEFYRAVCGSTLEPVLEACRIVAGSGTHLELVNLLVPGLNDDTVSLGRMCRWMAANLGDTVPVHFTRFSPAYRLKNLPPTPVTTIETAVRIARASGLQFVYVGNVPGHDDESTGCPGCGRLLVKRRGFSVLENNLLQGACRFCGRHIPGVFE
ncbi:AmmeMemoRadiSam system radical SAM enzyme [candidate division WOR-3 bacterium]|nr:AmmeMemoRadiSam system radical SAM enzyme [candidate division WOR-3 bacterium]